MIYDDGSMMMERYQARAKVTTWCILIITMDTKPSAFPVPSIVILAKARKVSGVGLGGGE